MRALVDHNKCTLVVTDMAVRIAKVILNGGTKSIMSKEPDRGGLPGKRDTAGDLECLGFVPDEPLSGTSTSELVLPSGPSSRCVTRSLYDGTCCSGHMGKSGFPPFPLTRLSCLNYCMKVTAALFLS